MKFDAFEVLTFDCYGTLIDWETGILGAIVPVLNSHNINFTPNKLLELYGAFETKEEEGEYRDYKTIQSAVMARIADHFGFTLSSEELTCISDSIKDWLPFPDTVTSLQALHRRFKLAIISNIDDDLFSTTQRQLQVEFDWVITAQQVRSYKPSEINFRKALERMNISKRQVLHVAQSVFHDLIPAKRLGLNTVWVNRRHTQQGAGAIPPAHERADAEVSDLGSLVKLMGLREG